MAEQNEVKTLKLDKRFITPLLTGEKRVTRRRTENHYERSRVAPEVWYYRKLFQKDTWLEISDEEACLIPRGTELLITTSEQRVTEHAPVRPGETILFAEPLPGGKYAPVATATVTHVRPEFIQDISEAEARREGFTSVDEFTGFMESLYPGIWQRNESVWVYEFSDVQAVEGRK